MVATPLCKTYAAAALLHSPVPNSGLFNVWVQERVYISFCDEQGIAYMSTLGSLLCPIICSLAPSAWAGWTPLPQCTQGCLSGWTCRRGAETSGVQTQRAGGTGHITRPRGWPPPTGITTSARPSAPPPVRLQSFVDTLGPHREGQHEWRLMTGR